MPMAPPETFTGLDHEGIVRYYESYYADMRVLALGLIGVAAAVVAGIAVGEGTQRVLDNGISYATELLGRAE